MSYCKDRQVLCFPLLKNYYCYKYMDQRDSLFVLLNFDRIPWTSHRPARVAFIILVLVGSILHLQGRLYR